MCLNPYNIMVEKNLSLVLKITLQGVNKPPVWREVQVPGGMDFMQLHRTIQCLYGLGNCHLWIFGRCAYDQDLSIGPDGGNGDLFITHVAAETPVLNFLKKKGNRLIYTYDFGDSWEFSVTVKQVVKETLKHPAFTGWKGNLQPMEDCGGVWCYAQMREFLVNEASLTAREKKEIAESLCFEDYTELKECLRDQIIDPEIIVKGLGNI